MKTSLIFALTLLVFSQLACQSSANVGSGNPAHDALLQQDPHQRVRFLGYIAGEGCDGTRDFYQGMDKAHNAYWDVACTNGKSYQIQFAPDARGNTKILACDFLEQVANIHCFTRVDSPDY